MPARPRLIAAAVTVAALGGLAAIALASQPDPVASSAPAVVATPTAPTATIPVEVRTETIRRTEHVTPTVTPQGGTPTPRPAAPAPAAPAPAAPSAAVPITVSDDAGGRVDRDDRDEAGDDRDEAGDDRDEDRSGHGGGDDEDRSGHGGGDDRSGSGHGGGDESDDD